MRLCFAALLCLAGAPEVQRSTFQLADGSEVVVSHPDVVQPLIPFDVVLDTADAGMHAVVAGPLKLPLEPSVPTRVYVAGAEGEHTIEVLCDGEPVGTFNVTLMAETTFDAEPYAALFDTLCRCVRQERDVWTRDGHAIATNPTWVRDHIHEMKAYKYWEDDLSSFVDALLELQHAEGFFYEILGRAGHDHQTFVSEKHVLVEPEKDLCWIRLEMEADVEYLMVEAAYHIWQATGDIEALRARLPALERGLRYDFTHPTRWDNEHGALKRTFSIDTWDFTYGVSDKNRRIEPGLPMGIMHGDNSGLYQACEQLAAMLRAAGEAAKAGYWEQEAAELRERINKLCFNGRYYTHQILLQPVETGVKEEDILSLSNTYDINRGLPSHEMAMRIIDEYQARRRLRADTHFAEWFSIDPPYPQFGPYPAGRYINGGIAGFVAGELAKASFHHGREAYAVDILNRVTKKVAEDGTLHFLYDAQGRNMGGGPRGWGAAAVISALVEGLAGIRDESALFREVTVAPRFVAAGIDQAYVCARYGPSGAYVAIEYRHSPEQRTVVLRISGTAEKFHFKVLLPAEAQDARAIAPSGTTAKLVAVEESRYLCCDLPAVRAGGETMLALQYDN